MSTFFRGILIIGSVLTWFYISRKLKKSQADTHDVVFWLLFSGVLILVSLFPQIADELARIMEVKTTENTVFLIIIFALLIRVFLLTLKVSQLGNRIRVLVEELALREKGKEEKRQKKQWVEPRLYFYERPKRLKQEEISKVRKDVI